MWSSTELGLKDCGGFIRRRGGIGEVLQLGYLLLPSRVAYRLQGMPARVGGLEHSNKWREGHMERKICVCHQR